MNAVQMEVQDLRVQLSHSISREEIEVLKRELQKTEKQRVQLTDHIEVYISVDHSPTYQFHHYSPSGSLLSSHL